MNCLNCQVETNNPKYCSRSCSAKLTNKLFPKRKVERLCAFPACVNLATNYRTKRCLEHKPHNIPPSTTLGIIHSRLSVKSKHPSWANSYVRVNNRRVNKVLIKLPCQNCGYDKHVELCHIRAITDFPDTATLGEVNAKENVIQLCRNCHWEFDHGLLSL